MGELFKLQSKIKHADWPYILQNFAFYFFLVWVGTMVFPAKLFYIFLAFLSVFYIVVTQFHIYRIQNREQEHQLYKYQCISILHNSLPLNAPLPPMTGWAATPELAVAVLNSIQKYKPNLIVELGSGVSTLVSGYALKKFNPEGKVVSLDHDEQYANKTSEEVTLHKLSDIIELRYAPLQNHTIENKTWKWYSKEKLTFDGTIDMLLIDGPPFKTQKNARYPALPILFSKLNTRAVIIVHDTQRKTESETVRRWLEEHDDLLAESLQTEKGITILKKGF